MMKIKNIEIENYRSCYSTKFSLIENLTALIGINGAGKTNILTALKLFSKMPSRRHNGVFYDEGDDFFRTSINLEMELFGQTVFVRTIFYHDIDESNNDIVTGAEIKYRILGENSRKWNNIDNEIIEVLEYVRRKRNNQLRLPKRYENIEQKYDYKILDALTSISYYSATQFSDPTKCPISIDSDEFRNPFRRQIAKTHNQFILDLYDGWVNDSKSFAVFINTVGMMGLELIENLDFIVHKIPSSSYKVRAGGEVREINNEKSIIVPSIYLDGLRLSPNQLSEGTFKTLALVFYILSDENQLILIEEPEVCVHHGLLNSILNLVIQRSKVKQIIISTHSDYVLDSLQPSNVLLVKKDVDQGTTAKNLTNYLSANDYEALKDYLKNSGNLGEYWREGGFENE